MLIYLPLIWWLWKTPYGAQRRRRDGAPASGGGFADAIEVLREVSGNRTIVSMILLAGVSSLLVGNAFLAQMPEYAHDLGTEKADFSYAVLLAANAAGAFAGGMILEAEGLLRSTPRTAIVLTILWCFSIAGFAPPRQLSARRRAHVRGRVPAASPSAPWLRRWSSSKRRPTCAAA